MTRKERAAHVLRRLQDRYPRLAPHLAAHDAWELTVATVLAAQCTDKRVNMVTPHLFARWPDPASLARADSAALEEVIRSTGFYRNKAKNLIAAAQRVTEVFGGVMPRTMADLLTLPGVARKTANVVLWGAFGINEGLAVDTHVGRIAKRLGLTGSDDPVTVEKDLMQLFPQEEWGNVNHRMVSFGRDVCGARKPACGTCDLGDICPRNGVA